MTINDILKAEAIKKYGNILFNTYQKSEGVKFLLKNGIDVKNSLEYFYGWHHAHSFSTTAILFNDSKIFELMIKNRKKFRFNPKERLEELGKNTYKVARILGRDSMIKILEKHSIKLSSKDKISKKDIEILFAGFKHSECSYENIQRLKTKKIDILNNVPLLKACFMANSLFRGAIIHNDEKLVATLLKYKEYFKIYEWGIEDNLTWQIAKNTKNKKIISLIEKERKAVDKLPFMDRGHHLIASDRCEEALALAETKLDWDKSWEEGGRYIKAFALQHINKNKEASDVLFERLEHDHNDTRALSLGTIALGNGGEHLMALEYVDRMIKIDKKNNSVALQYDYFTKAHILERIGDDVGALYYCKKALGQFKRKNQKVKKIIEANKESNKNSIKRCEERIKSGPDMRLFEFLGSMLDKHGKGIRHNKTFMTIRRRICVRGKKNLGPDRPTDLEKELD